MRMGGCSWLPGAVPPVTHTHALFAEQSQSLPNNLVASSGHILGPERAICGGDYFSSEAARRHGSAVYWGCFFYPRVLQAEGGRICRWLPARKRGWRAKPSLANTVPLPI